MPKKKVIVKEPSKIFFDAIHQIVSEKGFKRTEVIEVIEAGLIAAYRKKYKTTDNTRVRIDKDNEEVYILAEREVVNNVVLHGMQIDLNDARKINPDAQIGDVVEVKEYPQDYGRIAAQTAMQVISQRLRAIEQTNIRDEYSGRVGELMNGYILRKRGDTVYVDLGKVEAIMPVKHQIPGEKYRVEDKIKVLLYSIENESKGQGTKVLVSRSDKKFVQKLFEMEVPEIYEKIVEVKNIARDAGRRTKIVVHSDRSDVDPVGACVGLKGVRIQSIIRELGNERIDIIEYSEDPKEMITNALSPASPVFVRVDLAERKAVAVVGDNEERSLAIGKDGSNVKLASYITGFRIEVIMRSDYDGETNPEIRKQFDSLFTASSDAEEEEEGTPLSDLPGLAPRIKKLLYEGGIKYIEDLVSMGEDDLIGLEGIGRSTAKKIMDIISENVEFEEEEDAKDKKDSEE